jgi:hypothetical protein
MRPGDWWITRVLFLLLAHGSNARVIIDDVTLSNDIVRKYQDAGGGYYGIISNSVAYFDFRDTNRRYDVDIVLNGKLRSMLVENTTVVPVSTVPSGVEGSYESEKDTAQFLLADLKQSSIETITLAARKFDFDFVILIIDDHDSWTYRFRFWWSHHIPGVPFPAKFHEDEDRYIHNSSDDDDDDVESSPLPRSTPPYFLAVSRRTGKCKSLSCVCFKVQHNLLD